MMKRFFSTSYSSHAIFSCRFRFVWFRLLAEYVFLFTWMRSLIENSINNDRVFESPRNDEKLNYLVELASITTHTRTHAQKTLYAMSAQH